MSFESFNSALTKMEEMDLFQFMEQLPLRVTSHLIDQQVPADEVKKILIDSFAECKRAIGRIVGHILFWKEFLQILHPAIISEAIGTVRKQLGQLEEKWESREVKEEKNENKKEQEFGEIIDEAIKSEQLRSKKRNEKASFSKKSDGLVDITHLQGNIRGANLLSVLKKDQEKREAEEKKEREQQKQYAERRKLWRMRPPVFREALFETKELSLIDILTDISTSAGRSSDFPELCTAFPLLSELLKVLCNLNKSGELSQSAIISIINNCLRIIEEHKCSSESMVDECGCLSCLFAEEYNRIKAILSEETINEQSMNEAMSFLLLPSCKIPNQTSRQPASPLGDHLLMSLFISQTQDIRPSSLPDDTSRLFQSSSESHSSSDASADSHKPQLSSVLDKISHAQLSIARRSAPHATFLDTIDPPLIAQKCVSILSESLLHPISEIDSLPLVWSKRTCTLSFQEASLSASSSSSSTEALQSLSSSTSDSIHSSASVDSVISPADYSSSSTLYNRLFSLDNFALGILFTLMRNKKDRVVYLFPLFKQFLMKLLFYSSNSQHKKEGHIQKESLLQEKADEKSGKGSKEKQHKVTKDAENEEPTKLKDETGKGSEESQKLETEKKVTEPPVEQPVKRGRGRPRLHKETIPQVEQEKAKKEESTEVDLKDNVSPSIESNTNDESNKKSEQSSGTESVSESILVPLPAKPPIREHRRRRKRQFFDYVSTVNWDVDDDDDDSDVEILDEKPVPGKEAAAKEQKKTDSSTKAAKDAKAKRGKKQSADEDEDNTEDQVKRNKKGKSETSAEPKKRRGRKPKKITESEDEGESQQKGKVSKNKSTTSKTAKDEENKQDKAKKTKQKQKSQSESTIDSELRNVLESELLSLEECLDEKTFYERVKDIARRDRKNKEDKWSKEDKEQLEYSEKWQKIECLKQSINEETFDWESEQMKKEKGLLIYELYVLGRWCNWLSDEDFAKQVKKPSKNDAKLASVSIFLRCVRRLWTMGLIGPSHGRKGGNLCVDKGEHWEIMWTMDGEHLKEMNLAARQKKSTTKSNELHKMEGFGRRAMMKMHKENSEEQAQKKKK
ncbi:uncharacterized protein MONOS_6499 [Monocercomonoides exilis]|uniref:uncharacterized protein n=1 Tax=Monocercomonoides exilis TaxID=2049356 RepID=UPI00355981BC|nr:hypothetical protein MONOS_6499 [Monocercomonoides exilis]|eukprot:MONOS_6499.1-p1 / transcript=MONOS_6499.1 / gene=MONOS_6499 / organism=Monocercomonoides_exilis_PA203 / gene_product=unspecified product / transcript_product=unspecified product / location=Mono_scaffold00205:70792-74354(+) / protein_length=1078 / sequence_SO=supercontig / SO=protein_coding / is_pseudo=false